MKSAFFPALPLPLPGGLVEVILLCFWIHSVHTSTHSPSLDIVLHGVVSGTQGSAPRSSLVALVVFLMETQSFLPDSFYCCMLVSGTSLGKCLALLLGTRRQSGNCHPRVRIFHTIVCLDDEMGWLVTLQPAP